MKKILLSTVIALSNVISVQAAETEIRVHYAIPTIWSDTQQILSKAFMDKNPDINVIIDGPAESYGDGSQRLLRESIAGTAPDVAYVGLNLWRVLEDRGLAQPIDSFIGDDPLLLGYTPALLSLGRYKDTQYALATSASTMVMYVNPELVKKAGGSMDNFPTTFDGVIDLAAKINALGSNIDGIWVSPHDWRFQSLLGSYGGRPMNKDETDITFDNVQGITAAGLYQRFSKEAGMKTYSENDARQAFPAGALGIMFESSSLQARFTEGAGDKFNLTVKPTPIASDDKSKVYFPTGGSAIVMLAKDKVKQQAVWKYMAFVTSPEGQKIIVENTGYAPANSILIEDKVYLGDFYKKNPNALVAHTQIANYAGPWFAYPGAEGVAATELVSASLVEVTEGADPSKEMKGLAETMRDLLGMK